MEILIFSFNNIFLTILLVIAYTITIIILIIGSIISFISLILFSKNVDNKIKIIPYKIEIQCLFMNEESIDKYKLALSFQLFKNTNNSQLSHYFDDCIKETSNFNGTLGLKTLYYSSQSK